MKAFGKERHRIYSVFVYSLTHPFSDGGAVRQLQDADLEPLGRPPIRWPPESRQPARWLGFRQNHLLRLPQGPRSVCAPGRRGAPGSGPAESLARAGSRWLLAVPIIGEGVGGGGGFPPTGVSGEAGRGRGRGGRGEGSPGRREGSPGRGRRVPEYYYIRKHFFY